MAGKQIDKSINVLERDVRKMVNVVMELKKKDRRWQQKKAEIEKRLKGLIKRIEELSGEEEG